MEKPYFLVSTPCIRSLVRPPAVGCLDVGCALMRVRVVPARHRDDDIDQNQQAAFEVVGFAVAEKVTHNQDRKDEQYDHEDLEVQVHFFAHSPAYDDDKGCVEKRGLDGWTEAVEEGKVYLVVPGSLLVNLIFIFIFIFICFVMDDIPCFVYGY